MSNPSIGQIDTGYRPRPLQAYCHTQLKRFNVIVAHRGFGKTILVINELIDQALRCKWKDPTYAYIAPTYTQAERIAWDCLKAYSKMIPGVTYNETKLVCTIPRPWLNDRVKIMLLGAENPDSLRGMHLNGVVLDEFAQHNPIVWSEIVRPALTNRKAWSLFIGTPKGQNNFYEIYKIAVANKSGEWYSAVFKASTSKVIDPVELAAIKDETDEDKFNQEYECNFNSSLSGSYWGRQIVQAEADGRVGKVPFDSALSVHTFFDLGINDTTAIWFAQFHRNEIRIIDHLEMSGQGLEWYAKKMKEGHRAHYDYSANNWPHDGGSRDLSTGKERSSVWRELTGKAPIVHVRYDVSDGIQAARRMIARCHFDKAKCFHGLEALKNYQKRWDSKNRIWLDTPLHDWASNSADAFRLMAMSMRPGHEANMKNLPRSTVSDYNIFNPYGNNTQRRPGR